MANRDVTFIIKMKDQTKGAVDSFAKEINRIKRSVNSLNAATSKDSFGDITNKLGKFVQQIGSWGTKGEKSLSKLRGPAKDTALAFKKFETVSKAFDRLGAGMANAKTSITGLKRVITGLAVLGDMYA